MGGALFGIAKYASIPARLPYADQAAPALPFVGSANARTPSSRAREIPIAAPRALKLPVGSKPSSLILSDPIPDREPLSASATIGVVRSPSDTRFAASRTGSNSLQRHNVSSRASIAARVAEDATRSRS